MHDFGKMILKKAKRDHKIAEMNGCGLWKNVKDCRDALGFLHDETNSLLKIKYILDTKTDALILKIKEKTEILKTLREKFVDAQRIAVS